MSPAGRLTDSDGNDLLGQLRQLKLTNSRCLQELSSLYTAGLAEHPQSHSVLQREEFIDAKQARRQSPNLGRARRDVTVPQPFRMSLRGDETRERTDLLGAAQTPDLQSQEDPECLKQFRAQPVPAHVFISLYSDLVEQREARRKSGVQERKEFLIRTQKPFRFLSKEEEKRKAAAQTLLTPVEAERGIKREVPRCVRDPEVSDRLKEADLMRKVKSEMRAGEMLRSSSAPVSLHRGRRDPLSSVSLKTQQERLGFLQQNLTFQPHTNPSVPDFQRLHRDFQKQCLKNQKETQPTRSKPFTLRTSSRRRRERQRDAESGQDGRLHLETSARSFRSLSSLSSNTLPVYITDSARRRLSAVRTSLQEKNRQERQAAERTKQGSKRSLRLQSSVSRRAKAMDPHRPLAESIAETLRQNRQSERKRMKEYEEELEQMQCRVKARPYLFELITKGNAVKEAERKFTDSLQQVGLSEEFLQNKGRSQEICRKKSKEAEE